MNNKFAGICVFSAEMTLTRKQFKEIWAACYETECIDDGSNFGEKTDQLYCYAYRKRGVKVYLHGECGEQYHLKVEVEPCRVLRESGRAVLAKLDKERYKKLISAVDSMLKKLSVPVSIDGMKICRCDLATNVEFSNRNELMEYLRIFKKSLHIPSYTPVSFKINDHKVKNAKTANKHSYCIACKSASFLIYDKIAQLEMIDRLGEALAGKNILRFEAKLRCAALERHLGLAAMESNYKLLSTAAQSAENVISWHLHRMQPVCMSYLRYEIAAEIVEGYGLQKKAKDRMLYLLRKTSSSESLAAALKMLQHKYRLTDGQCREVIDNFEELGISPITLPNSSDYDELPSVHIYRSQRLKTLYDQINSIEQV